MYSSLEDHSIYYLENTNGDRPSVPENLSLNTFLGNYSNLLTV